jgi:hypothetical protein
MLTSAKVKDNGTIWQRCNLIQQSTIRNWDRPTGLPDSDYWFRLQTFCPCKSGVEKSQLVAKMSTSESDYGSAQTDEIEVKFTESESDSYSYSEATDGHRAEGKELYGLARVAAGRHDEPNPNLGIPIQLQRNAIATGVTDGDALSAVQFTDTAEDHDDEPSAWRAPRSTLCILCACGIPFLFLLPVWSCVGCRVWSDLRLAPASPSKERLLCLWRSFGIASGIVFLFVLGIVIFVASEGLRFGHGPDVGTLFVYFVLPPVLSGIAAGIAVAFMVVASRIIRAADKNRAASQLRSLNLCANSAALLYFTPLFILSALIVWRRFRSLPVDSRCADRALLTGAMSVIAMVLTALAWIHPYEIASPFAFNPNILIASLIGIFFCVLLAAGVVFTNAVDKELYQLIFSNKKDTTETTKIIQGKAIKP